MTTATPIRTTGPARLRVRPRRTERAVEHQRRHLGSLPFLGLIAAILSLGLLSLLLINNSLAAGSFEQSRLKADSILLGEQEQALSQEVQRLSSPTNLRDAARQAGLMAAATTAYIDISTGRILGTPMPAGATPGSATSGDLATPLTPDSTDPAVTDPTVTDPTTTPDPTTTDPTTDPTDSTASDPSASDPTAPDSAGPDSATGDTLDQEGSDGAAVGPAGETAYDRAIVSGGGR